MLIIHAADLHLSSPLTSLPSSVREIKKNALNTSLIRIINLAKERSIKHILLSGDVFDGDIIFDSVKKDFYSTIKSNPDITFYYLKGNHDKWTNLVEKVDNLITFSNKWEYHYIDNVCIAGMELDEDNRIKLNEGLKLNKDNYNILMLHGDINTQGTDYINLNQLKNKLIDYIALGHIHSFKSVEVDSRGVAVYSGCVEGRGFDECGKKGVVILDTDTNKYEFIPLSKSEISVVDFDASAFSSTANLIIALNESGLFKEGQIYQLNLIGTKDNSNTIKPDHIVSGISSNSHIQVVDKRTIKLDLDELMMEHSLRGEFVRQVMQDCSISEEEKNEVIMHGLQLINQGVITWN